MVAALAKATVGAKFSDTVVRSLPFLSEHTVRRLVPLLLFVEVTIGIGLLAIPSDRLVRLLAAGLFTVFTVYAVFLMRKPTLGLGCACFGRTEPANWRMVARNLSLCLLALSPFAETEYVSVLAVSGLMVSMMPEWKPRETRPLAT